MGKIISVGNQKGGVGKTSSVNAIAMGLKHKGYRVLCIDFDPQGNLSFSMETDGDQNPNIYDVLKRTVKCRYAIQQTELGEIIPSTFLLSGMEMDFTGKGREFVLRDCLETVRAQYDYILIDTPPELGVLTINAFCAADVVLVPVLTDIYSLQGIARLHDTIEHIRKSLNPKLKIGGIFLVRYNQREELSRIVLQTAEMIANEFGIPLLKTTIRGSVMIGKIQAAQKDMMEYASKNKAVMDYMALVEELLKKVI